MRRLGMVLLAILFLFMVFAGPATQKADAVVVSTVIIGAVIAALAAAGIGLTVSGMTSAQLSDWLGGKLNDWATSLGGSVEDHINGNLITMTARGLLSIGTSAAQGISDFISWLQNEDTITNNETIPVITGGTTVIKISDDNYHAIMKGGGSYYSVKRKTQHDLYVVAYDDGDFVGPLIVSEYQYDQFYICRTDHYVDPGYSGYDAIGDTNRADNNGNTNLFWNLMWSLHWVSLEESEVSVYSSKSSACIAIRNAIDSDVYETPSLSYETTVIEVPTIEQTDKWFLDIGADPGDTVQTATDGVIADTIEGTLTVSGEVAEEEPPFEVTGPIGISGLTEVFPFCIPFDVYALLSCLSAEPQTPVFTVRFVIPGVINQEFTIDLSPFSTIAQIVRTMELIAFAIGLALVTRERFLRS